MESSESNSKSNSEEVSSELEKISSDPDISCDSEINGETTVLENVETTAMEVVESETVVNSEENEIQSDAKSEDKDEETPPTIKEEITLGELTSDEQENKIERKGRKRKISEPIAQSQKSSSESNETSRELIEDENSEKIDDKKSDDKDSSPDVSLSSCLGFGKGKRARIPNKRYSDIAVSPAPKIVKSSNLENGEKEKPVAAVPTERVEVEPIRTSSPVQKRPKMSSLDLGNPNFLKPFKLGWKRELVWRSVGCDITGKRNGDIYYYSPEGKKLRSMREVAENLSSKSRGLSIEDFTFFKEPLGLNDPEKEVIRDAKIKSGGGSWLASKKSIGGKTKKIASPKVQSPKLQSPKIQSPKLNSSKVQSPKSDTSTTVLHKLGTPRVNLTKLEHTEEGKTAKSLKSAQSAHNKLNNTTADSGSEGKNAKTTTTKPKIGPKSKIEKKTPVVTKQAAVVTEEQPMGGKKATPRKSGKNAQKPITSDSSAKIQTTPKKKTLKINNITSQPVEKTNESKLMENYLQNLSYGYNTLLYVFQYLKVQDLLRAGCVCTMWRDIASHPLLWRTVRMKNSQVHSFEGLANTLQKHGTVQLDLRKMLLTNCDEIWPEFSNNIGKVDTLRKIELCRCPASVVEKLTETNPKLEVVNAVTIRCEKMSLKGLSNWTNLRELRLKSTTGLALESDIDSLQNLVNLKILSLTSIRDLNTMKLDVISELTNLESLDLGECTDFPKNFGKDIISKLTKLEKLRLEKGQGNCHTFEILEAVKGMPHLEQLELVNFDIKTGFDKSLGTCKNIKKLLIIPTYISQSATTNHMVLGGVLRLQKSLSHFVWGVTLELLRVTELFVDQCEEPEKKEKKDKKSIGNGDSIPVLKPVPLITDDQSEIPPALDPPQVEILALPGLQKLLLQSLPTTRVKILKIPFHATWRQSITDAVN